MKKNLFIIFFLLTFSCSGPDKNPLIVPPNYSEIPQTQNTPEKDKENIGNQEKIDRLKEMLQKND
ncbi:MAG: hypothetical protein EBT63_02330 [Proteobacteria bacterium]|nr:hypothetical protein [Pseudomonadota bacterium]NCA28104.1 hypothetical protein [Pseudomonadota bacterium]